ncbi:hypothetical protein DH2020_026415 [Rehmannia glutinosa]|uniref:Carbonic anhydrase n=1 Tax=Rehmannia glutinosa TaxID=99300 RepID=A0ABR0W109_REHGL
MAAFLAFFFVTFTLLIAGSYASTTSSPDKWASLNPSFTLCATGKSQSPINIVTDQVVINKKLKPLVRNYHAVNVTLVDNKFTVAIEYPDHTGGIIVDDKPYSLKQMHWHSPSEHRINGNRFAAELHMVHVSDDGNVSVVATLFKYGQPDPLLTKIHNKLNELAYNVKSQETISPITIGQFHPAELRKTSRKYYRYIGSSSVPPCSENLMYLVLGKRTSRGSQGSSGHWMQVQRQALSTNQRKTRGGVRGFQCSVLSGIWYKCDVTFIQNNRSGIGMCRT